MKALLLLCSYLALASNSAIASAIDQFVISSQDPLGTTGATVSHEFQDSAIPASGNFEIDQYSSSKINVLSSGIYQVTYRANYSGAPTNPNIVNSSMALYLNSGFHGLGESISYSTIQFNDLSYQDAFGSLSATFYAELLAGQFLHLRSTRPSGNANATINLVPSGNNIAFRKISDLEANIIETGLYDNIALTGYNNLTSASYSASSSNASPEGAFDGYAHVATGIVINDDATSPVGNGIWNTPTGQNVNQWIRIDFGLNVSVSSFRVYTNSTVTNMGRRCKNVDFRFSNDGVNFSTHESFVLSNIEDEIITFSSALHNVRYVELFCANNYGHSIIQIDELEIYQP